MFVFDVENSTVYSSLYFLVCSQSADILSYLKTVLTCKVIFQIVLLFQNLTMEI